MIAVIIAVILFVVFGYLFYIKSRAAAAVLQVQCDVFFTSSLDMCAVAGTEGYFIRVNPACQTILGYTAEEFCSIPYLELVHPDDIERTTAEVEKQKDGSKVLNFENRYKAKDGSYKWLSWKSTPVGGLMYGVARDITDQKRSLINTQENFKAVADNMSQLAWVTDKNLDFVWMNSKWYSYFHQRPKNLLDSTWKNSVHPEDYDRYVKTVTGALMNDSSYCVEYRMRKSDHGEYTWLYRTCSPIKNELGEVTKWVGTCADIQDQKNQFSKISLERQTMDLIINNIEGIIWSSDREGIITFYDGAGAGKIGVKSSDRIGKNVYELNKSSLQFKEHMEKALAGETVALELSRGPLIFQNFMAPIKNHLGEIQGVVGYGVDITDRKRIEKERNEARMKEEQLRQSEKAAQEASKMKSEFLANMSHEIRTPINGVIGMTGLLLDTKLDTVQQEYADNIRICSESLLTVINDILDFSKVEAGKLQLENTEFNLGEMIEDSVKALSYQVNKKALNINIKKDNFKTTFSGDSGRIRQVLTNLLNNAIKFTHQGSVTLSCAMQAEKNNQAYLRFEIIDTGIGISETGLKRLFQSFNQADNSVNRKFGGTGLGLTISKKLVELMGGSIGVESKENAGSKFWFEIALSKGCEIQSANAEVLRELEFSVPRKQFRILVAEDNPINQKVTLRQLEKIGYYADAVANGVEVLSALELVPYDLILMDCQMPELDGYEATKKIRALANKKISYIPIIALTANALSRDRDLCLEAGMNDYLTKPTKVEELAKTLEIWTARKVA